MSPISASRCIESLSATCVRIDAFGLTDPFIAATDNLAAGTDAPDKLVMLDLAQALAS
jgi:hypothetical protein